MGAADMRAAAGFKPSPRWERLVEEEVVARAKRGNADATEYLLRKYRSLVEGKARTFFLVGAQRDDVVQEGMIGLFKAIRDYRSDKPAAFKSFAETCVTRQIITAAKMATRKKHLALNTSVSLDVLPENGSGEVPVSPGAILGPVTVDPENVILGKDAVREIAERMRTALSELERIALSAYVVGRSYHEIARALELSSKQIDNALQRAKRKLKRRLQENLAPSP